MNIVIDSQFQDLLVPLTADERRLLEESIGAEGCRDPLVVWPTSNDTAILIDGHNRFEICERLGLDYETTEREFASRDEAVLWINENQLGRRNLTDDQRAIIAAKTATQRSAIEKRRRAQAAGETGGRGRPKAEENSLPHTVCEKLSDRESPKPAPVKDTRAAVAKSAGLPRRKLEAGQKLLKAAPELAEKVQAGQMPLKKAMAAVRAEEREAERKQAAKAVKAVVRDDHGVLVGRFQDVAKDIPDNSVDLIFTDPPYHREFLPLYDDLAAVADRVLKPGGSLITYLGQYQIDEVTRRLSSKLRLWWTCAVMHTGQSARMTEYGVVVKWKPLLWYVKGTRGDKLTFVEDLVVSEREKDAHPWQQSVREASYYIDKLTMPGQMVFDPFCGGGTTAIAAKALGRQWLTCDIDETSALIARGRIANNT